MALLIWFLLNLAAGSILLATGLEMRNEMRAFKRREDLATHIVGLWMRDGTIPPDISRGRWEYITGETYCINGGRTTGQC